VTSVVSTQPVNISVPGADGQGLASRQPAGVDGSENSDAPSDAIQIVTVDANAQRLGELESVVSQDLTTDITPN
jgi:hypothetical protein